MVKNKKLPKDPSAPKMPKRPFIYFSMEVSKDVREELSKDPTFMGNEVNFQQQGKIAKACGEKWKALSEIEKEKYQKMYKEDIKRYQEEMRSYTPSPEYLEKVERARLKNSVASNHDKDFAKVPYMVRAYFEYLTSTWSRIAASNPRLNPREVQEEVWRRWSRGESRSGGAHCKEWDENRNLQKNPRKRIRKRSFSSESTALNPPRQAFQCYLEQMTVELRKCLPDMSYSEAVKHASAKWKDMSSIEKEPFFVKESAEKKNNEDHIKHVKIEGEGEEPNLKENSVVCTPSVPNNEKISEDVESQKIENVKSISVELDVESSASFVDEDFQIHSQEECRNDAVAVQKDKDGERSKIKIENARVDMIPSSSSSSSDDSSDDSYDESSDDDSDTSNNDL